MAKLPPTWAELLAVADAKLFKQPGSGVAKRLFAAAGDEIMDDDYDLIESNDILYLSCGEDWRAPAAALAVARRLVADGGACAGGSAGGALLREGCRRLPAAHGWLTLALAPFVEAHADGRGGGGLAPLLARLRRHAPALPREIRRLAAAAL